jgi:hypothetical protein
MTQQINSFEDFWPYYVCAHSHPVNQWLHFIATVSLVPLIVIALLYNPWIALLIPIFAYSLAWYGHYFVEKNKPATFGHPFWSLLADYRMIQMMCRGQMEAEVQRCKTLC